MERKKALPDPGIGVISYATPQRRTTPHRQAIALIVTALQRAGVKRINYDHVTCSVPKARIPLWINDGRVDIAFLQGDDIIFIELLAVPQDRIDLTEREDGDSDPG